MPRRNTIADFWTLVDVRGPNDCWPWLGYIQPNGYAYFTMDRVKRTVHDWAHLFEIGPIPQGEHVDHLCHTTDCTLTDRACPHRRCCNPAHIQAKTPRANILRGNSPLAVHARKTCCPTCGGPYDLIDDGARRCSNCKNRRQRERADALRPPGSMNLGQKNAAKTCCPKCGGPYYVNKAGGRRCRACKNRLARESRQHL